MSSNLTSRRFMKLKWRWDLNSWIFMKSRSFLWIEVEVDMKINSLQCRALAARRTQQPRATQKSPKRLTAYPTGMQKATNARNRPLHLRTLKAAFFPIAFLLFIEGKPPFTRRKPPYPSPAPRSQLIMSWIRYERCSDSRRFEREVGKMHNCSACAYSILQNYERGDVQVY